jgi:hypothetical protein
MDDTKARQQRSSLGVSHDEIQERLPEYATGIMLGRDVRHEYQAVADHLETCLECQAELIHMLSLGGMLYRGEVEPAPVMPAFRLSFLPSAQHRPWWRDAIGRLLVQFSAELLDSFRPAQALLATRGTQALRFQPQADPPDSFHLTIDIMDSRQDLVNLRVQIDFAERSPIEQDNTLVRAEADGRTWQGLTQESGLVTLTGIPRALLPSLRLTIEPPKREQNR